MKSEAAKPHQLQVDIANLQQDVPVNTRRLRRLLRQLFADNGIRRGSVSLALVDNQTISKLNRKYLGRQGPTDVLAFQFDEKENSQGPPPVWGEIVVSVEEASRQAEARGLPVETELLLYVIHGGLHLLGFDDSTKARGKKMEAAQQHYLNLSVKSKRPRRSI